MVFGAGKWLPGVVVIATGVVIEQVNIDVV